MTHRAGETFFAAKRDWSRRKDEILYDYLKPYLAKVVMLRKPVLLVDNFAGPGRFDDGSEGSPIILCRRAEEQIHLHRDVKVFCIERSSALYKKLVQNLASFEFAEAHYGSFTDYIEMIDGMAATHTLFLYLDPWTISGVDWSAIQRLAARIRSNESSVELLLNLNVASFARWGRAALKKPLPDLGSGWSEDESIDATMSDPPDIERLNHIAGGRWWADVLEAELDFPHEIRKLMSGFANQFAAVFPDVCYVPIFEKKTHSVPKYYLVFGSRQSDGLLLMNDRMVKAVRAGEFQTDFLLERRLDAAILGQCEVATPRLDVVTKVIREIFCVFTKSEIQQRVGKLLREGQLRTEPAGLRVNDQTKIVQSQLGLMN